MHALVKQEFVLTGGLLAIGTSFLSQFYVLLLFVK
jgi:hypothetical protein